MRKAYIIIKRNENICGLVYDRRLYDTKREADRDFKRNDTMIICNRDYVYYGDNFSGWQVEPVGRLMTISK